ncbi:MAG: ankyrin repeat domain-containing protein [Bacteroidota bacterium]
MSIQKLFYAFFLLFLSSCQATTLSNRQRKLMQAIESCDQVTLQKILDFDPITAEDLNAISNQCSWFTIFHQAARQLRETRKKMDILLTMIKKGADVNAVNPYGESLLYSVVSLGYEQTVELLLVHGANPNGSDGHMKHDRPLHKAAKDGSSSLVRLLILHNADPDAKDRDGNTATDLINDHKTLTEVSKQSLIKVLKEASLSRKKKARFFFICLPVGFLIAGAIASWLCPHEEKKE